MKKLSSLAEIYKSISSTHIFRPEMDSSKMHLSREAEELKRIPSSADIHRRSSFQAAVCQNHYKWIFFFTALTGSGYTEVNARYKNDE